MTEALPDVQALAAEIARKIEHEVKINSPESLPDALLSLAAQLSHYGRPCDCKKPRYNGAEPKVNGNVDVDPAVITKAWRDMVAAVYLGGVR